MAFRKFQSVEKTEVVSPEGHKAIGETVEGSLVDADDATKQRVARILDEEA